MMLLITMRMIFLGRRDERFSTILTFCFSLSCVCTVFRSRHSSVR